MTHRVARQCGCVYDLAAMIRARPEACHGSAQIAQIDHFAVLPQEGVHGGHARGSVGSETCIRQSDNYVARLAAAARAWHCVRAAECANVLQYSVLPNECPDLNPDSKHRERVGGGVVGKAYYLASIVDVDPQAGIAA